MLRYLLLCTMRAGSLAIITFSFCKKVKHVGGEANKLVPIFDVFWHSFVTYNLGQPSPLFDRNLPCAVGLGRGVSSAASLKSTTDHSNCKSLGTPQNPKITN